MLDAIGAGLAPRIGEKDWADIWRDSPEYERMRQEIEVIKQQGLARPAPDRSNESTCKSAYPTHELLLSPWQTRRRSGCSSGRSSSGTTGHSGVLQTMCSADSSSTSSSPSLSRSRSCSSVTALAISNTEFSECAYPLASPEDHH